jgi:7-cyano-7-deazaguanine synthase in queuosine biosynthesis
MYTIEFNPSDISPSGDTKWLIYTHDQSLSKNLFAIMKFHRFEEVYQRRLTPLYCDLLDIATAVYASDRVFPRRRKGIDDRYGRQWRRHIIVQLPLREAAHWNANARMDSLCTLLEHLTGDQWSFAFTQRSIPEDRHPQQQWLFPWQPARSLEVAPFSGGLDSLAGAYHRLVSNPDRVLALVAGGINNQLKARQAELFRALKDRFGDRLVTAQIRYSLWGRSYSADEDEPSQRSRGFVHLALTAVAALMFESATVAIYENGIGALGLPYSRAQIGTHISRAVHPKTLVHMSNFVREGLGQPLRFHNPYILETKGTMCARLTEPWLSRAIARSVSCDEFPQRVPGHAQCGVCPACLLRRVSLHRAGLADIDALSSYRFDVTEPTHALGERRLYRLRVMLDQVDLLRSCFDGVAWEELTLQFHELAEAGDILSQEEALSHTQVADALVALYRTYVEEWKTFPYQLPSNNHKLCA